MLCLAWLSVIVASAHAHAAPVLGLDLPREVAACSITSWRSRVLNAWARSLFVKRFPGMFSLSWTSTR